MAKKLVILFLLVFVSAYPQTNLDANEEGYHLVDNYSHEEYGAHYQNWFITQDKNGFIYSGNGDGILEFDGAFWRLISSPGLHAVRTVVVDDKNTKWVGADRELGYLEPDSLGKLQYKSLKDKIPEPHALTANIWQIFPHRGKVLFVTDNKIYCWEENKFKIIPHPGTGPIYREYQVNGEVYFNILEEGMFKIVGDSLQLIPQGEFFKTKRVVMALPYGDKGALFFTRESGLFIFDGKGITKMDEKIDNILRENSLYAGRRLPDSTYAIATLRGGVILMGEKGEFLKKISTEDGILNNQVHGLAVDDQNSLWLALQTGISKVEPLSPFTIFDERLGLNGTVSAINRHKNTLYVGTFDGLFRLKQGSSELPARFERVAGIESPCLSLLSSTDGLFAGTSSGIFLIKDNKADQISDVLGCRTLNQSKTDSNRIFVGHLHGLSSIYFNGTQWMHEKDFGPIKEDIFSIASENSGMLWLGTSLGQVIKVVYSVPNEGENIKDHHIVNITRYKEGLPEGVNQLSLIEGEVLVTTNNMKNPLYVLDADSGTFSPETEYGQRFGLDSLSVYPMGYQDGGKHILLESLPVNGKKLRFSVHKNGFDDYSVNRLYDEKFRSTTQTRLHWDNENQLWIGGEGIINYNISSRFDHATSFRAYIRKVTIGQDSLIYGGATSFSISPKMNFSNKSLRIEYASPSFSDSRANKYQYRLVGFDDDWSDWTEEIKKDYTNLSEGNYRFLVRSQNIYGDLSEAASFDFEILPPWHRTWWAYILYVLLFITLLWLLLRWRSSQLKAKNEALEELIALKTAEVRQQTNQLKVQTEKLKELDQAKSRFFANISHEFRTPLTLIKGPIEHLEQNPDEKLNREDIKMIRRNTNRVLGLVNQLLDLSRIDQGSLKLKATEGNVYKCLRAAAASFNSHAAQRNMDFRVSIPDGTLWAAFDRDKLEKIVYNLLSNAFKFSEDDEMVAFEVAYDDGELAIQVSDSGRGISEEKLPFIFDRFYQVDSSSTKEREGSGIGLSLSKDLVELMDGTITVSSEEGKGTYFTVQIPIEKIEIRQSKPKKTKTPVARELPEASPLEVTKPDKRNLPRIMLVEDNEDMRQFIKGHLLKEYRIQEAVNGEDGLKKAVSNPPDLVITDLMMPKMDGIDLCKQLKTKVDTSHIPIIMLTARAGVENKIEGLETGADDYLTKPFEAKELLVRTKNLIEQRQKLRELFSNSKATLNPKEIAVSSIDQKFLEQVLDLLEKEHADPNFGVSQMQKELAMSKTQLHRKLKALTNETPGELLRNFRLKRAAQLLSQKADTVTQIAYQVGFNNLSYFAKCFKELYGVTPSSYQS